MRSKYFSDAGDFLESCQTLLGDVARSRLILMVGGMARDQPDVYPEYHGWAVFDGRTPVAAALCTVPYNYVLADAVTDSALEPLAAGIAESGVGAPGVYGNLPTVESFVAAWAAETGCASSMNMGLGLFSLSEVAPLQLAPGTMRAAEPTDRDLLVRWQAGFYAEADPHGPNPRYPEERIDQSLDPTRPQGLYVWVDGGEVVSMSGYSPPIADAVAVGPVYTPPALRGRGYATALVATQTRRHLEEGSSRCLLNTDLANPTSNAIYQRIGYQQVAEARSYIFDTET